MTEEQWIEIQKGIEWGIYHDINKQKGGQQVSISPKGVHLIHRDFNFEIFCGNGRSQMENKNLALVLFKLYLEEIY